MGPIRRLVHTKYFKDRFIAAIKSTIDPLDVLCIFKLPAENLHFKIFRYFLSIYLGIITLPYISEQNHAGCQNSWTIVQLVSKVVEIGRKQYKKVYSQNIYSFFYFQERFTLLLLLSYYIRSRFRQANFLFSFFVTKVDSGFRKGFP